MSFLSNLFSGSPQPPTRVTAFDELKASTKRNGWFTAFLIIMLLLYWRFAVEFEQIDLSSEFREQFPLLAQIPLAITIREMFTLNAMRHLIPVVVGWWLAYETAVSVVHHLYNLPDTSGARRFLGRLQSGSGGAYTKALSINPKTLEADRQNSVLLRVGGPGKIKLPNTYVGVTELNDRFMRVLPPGKNTLHAFEYLHSVIDLRQQDRFINDAGLISLDGIPFTASINIVYRIKTDEHPNQQNPYPFDKDAVRIAAYNQTVVDDHGTVVGWENAPKIIAISTLSDIVSKYTLDEIFFPDQTGPIWYDAIQNEFERDVFRAYSNMGLELLEAHVVNMELPPKIKEIYIKYWQSQSDTEIYLRKLEGSANAYEKLESARADAEDAMLNAIAEGVKQAQKEGITSPINQIVALRMAEALERMATQSLDSKVQSERFLPSVDQLRRDVYESNPPDEDSAAS